MAERQEAKVTVIEGEWGKPTDPQKVAEALKAKAYKVITMVHAETSTEVLQPNLENISRKAG